MSVLVDAVKPLLPEILVRRVKMEGMKDDGVLVAHHPPSWNAPHMVEGYKDRRYYKRVENRTVLMTEADVSVAHQVRNARRESAEDWVDRANFGEKGVDHPVIRFVLVPRLPTAHRVLSWDFLKYLEANLKPTGASGGWVPFEDGQRFSSYKPGAVGAYSAFEHRIFLSGAFSFSADLAELPLYTTHERVHLPSVLNLVTGNVLTPAVALFEAVELRGPVAIAILLENTWVLKAHDNTEQWYAPSEDLLRPVVGNLRLFEESTVGEIRSKTEDVGLRMVDRLAAAFGMARATPKQST